MEKRRYAIFLGVCFVIFGLSLMLWADSQQGLDQAIKDKNTVRIKESAAQIARANTEKSLQTLLQAIAKLPPNDIESYWVILNSMMLLTDSKVIDKLGDFIIANKTKPVAGDLLFALKPNQSATIIPLLAKVIQKGNKTMQRTALEHLAEVYHKESIEVLVNFMKSPDANDAELRREAALSLNSITGLDQGSAAETWVTWWESNKDKEPAEIIKPKTGASDRTGTVADKLGFSRSVAFNRLTLMPADKIIVVSAEAGDCPCGEEHNFDRIQDILKRMKVPHKVVSKKKFNEDDYKLDDKWFVVINCNMFREHHTASTCRSSGEKTGLRLVGCAGPEPHNPYTPKLSDKTVKKIVDFIAEGGYLFSEDWVIEEVLERAFPHLVGHADYLTEQNVSILPGRGVIMHPYLKGVFEREADSRQASGTETVSVKIQSGIGQFKWKIDNDSPDIKINKPDEVTVLIKAPSFKTAGGGGDDSPVAITFGYSKGGLRPVVSGTDSAYSISAMRGGRVLHVLSHFGKQKSESEEYALQNLLINFLTELNERKAAVVGKK